MDGSCKGGTGKEPHCYLFLIVPCKRRGADHTRVANSYDEERSTMLPALNWMVENSRFTDAEICTDSQALYSQSYEEQHARHWKATQKAWGTQWKSACTL